MWNVMALLSLLLLITIGLTYSSGKEDIPEDHEMGMSPGYSAKYSVEIDGIPDLEHLTPKASVGPYPLMNRPVYQFECTPASIANLIDNKIDDLSVETTFTCFANPPGGDGLAGEQAVFTWVPVDGPPLLRDRDISGYKTTQLVIKGEYEDGGNYGYEMMIWHDEERVVYAVDGGAWWLEDDERSEGRFQFLMTELDGERVDLRWE